MVSLDKAVIARISRASKEFEVLVDPDKALKFRKGNEYSIENILAVREVFNDSKKGERASTTDLEQSFGTSDITRIATIIIREGDIQLTTEQRRGLTEEKKKQIANIISRQGINPKTKLPHPPARIINAMDQAHVNVDPFKPAEDQVQDILGKIGGIIPISLEIQEIAAKVPLQFAGKVSSAIRGMGNLKKEEWKPDCYIVSLEIPAGMQSEIYSKLNDLTSGTVEVKVIRSIGL